MVVDFISIIACLEVTYIHYLSSLQILMNVLITMGRVPISVSILKVVIIVSVPLDINFNLTIIIVKVNN